RHRRPADAAGAGRDWRVAHAAGERPELARPGALLGAVQVAGDQHRPERVTRDQHVPTDLAPGQPDVVLALVRHGREVYPAACPRPGRLHSRQRTKTVGACPLLRFYRGSVSSSGSGGPNVSSRNRSFASRLSTRCLRTTSAISSSLFSRRSSWPFSIRVGVAPSAGGWSADPAAT